MALYEELDAMFPSHTHYYVVNLPDMNDALERCARLTGGISNVVTYNGQMILAVQHLISSDISWLTEIAPPVVEEAPAEE